jgi:hypothetical protein
MIQVIIGSLEEIQNLLTSGWSLVSQRPLLDGRYQFVLKREC